MSVESVYAENTFTYVLTNDTITLLPQWGVTRISVKCTTATSGQVLGNGTLGALQSAPIELAQGDSLSYIAAPQKSLSGLTITAPAGCSLEITANGNL